MWTQQPCPWPPTVYIGLLNAACRSQILRVLTGGGSSTCSLGRRVRVRRGCVFEFPRLGCLITYNSCPLLPRVLESLLVSLVTTVVVFVASMVLGECRQMSSSQIGNDSLLLQVTPVHLPPLSCLRSKGPEMGGELRSVWVHGSHLIGF